MGAGASFAWPAREDGGGVRGSAWGGRLLEPERGVAAELLVEPAAEGVDAGAAHSAREDDVVVRRHVNAIRRLVQHGRGLWFV